MIDPENFLKYNYTETKDMCLHFLTLITAVLVFSLSFSEKVFDFHNSTKRKKLIVISGWCLFILSIIFCGLGLVANAIAGGCAVIELSEGIKHMGNYYHPKSISNLFILFSGSLFILGLIFSMIAAIIASQTIKNENTASINSQQLH